MSETRVNADVYSSLTDKDTDAGSEGSKNRGSAEVGSSSRQPDSSSGHLPTLLCSGLECVFPESTRKIFPGACSSFPATVIKKKMTKSHFGKWFKGLRGLFYLTCVFYH